MRERLVGAGKRFARLAARAVVAEPRLWRLFRGPLRRQFDWLAPGWDARRDPTGAAPVVAALDRIGAPPRRVLDVGTGTGAVVRLVAERYPEAEVTGVDLAPAMVAEARRLLPPEHAPRVRLEVADAASLPFEDGAFDLVLLLNMIPFPGELARVTAPGGALVVAFSQGPRTPIWAPPATVAARLREAGFEEAEELAAGTGTAVLARRSGRPAREGPAGARPAPRPS